ncbi:DUF1499 domain-containing protein [Halomonas sp. ZH2S]|uniref:DUF1499 domain-containing protein n=1 Tax=Vreelandella zhuhanensis TaxID=2684210 RepID=A0A7X3KQQ1_9GAMM|nr:DUF1499 domain-containing protein [Halomonas zhuhanensis]MWJ27541.1 DUF1499 domain-containing protein [Halomonas zhuhanensis]
MKTTNRGGRLPTLATGLALLALLLGGLLIAGAGPAYRLELFTLGEAFNTLRFGVYATIGAAAIGLVALLIAAICRRTAPALLSGLAILGAIALLSVPWQHWQRAQAVPPIHDITTDTQDPPAFEALAQAREEAPNAVDYPGEATARQQRQAYPNVEPLVVQASMETVLGAAQAEVENAGWQLAAVTDDKIEATATTAWFGFQDDVVIRLTQTDDGVRVDMRSASRIGRSDMGTNAARIKAFLERLEERLA